MGWRVPVVQGKEVLMIKLGLGFYSILFYSILFFYSIPSHSFLLWEQWDTSRDGAEMHRLQDSGSQPRHHSGALK